MTESRGLTSEEVRKSREKEGANVLTPPVRMHWMRSLLGKFKDPMVILLLAATLLCFVLGCLKGSFVESIAILAAVVLAVLIAFFSEYRAGREFDVINSIEDKAPAKVVRDGRSVRIPFSEIVAGDVVILEQGAEIPADGKLLDAINLVVNESTLNGEAAPSVKNADDYVAEGGAFASDADTSASGAYPRNRVYRGTTVTQGSGVMTVTEVGDRTQLGITARQASSYNPAPSPLEKQMNDLSRMIGIVALSVSVLYFVVLVTRGLVTGELSKGFSSANLDVLTNFLMLSITLLIVAIPEGLAVAVTLSLAFSMRKMSKNDALVRRLPACETMGATTMLCIDKTGTLTKNSMSVSFCSVPLSPRLAEAISSNSTATLDIREKTDEDGKTEVSLSVQGNATEGALLVHLYRNGFDYRQYRNGGFQMQHILFSPDSKYSASLVDSEFIASVGNNIMLYVKGNEDAVLSRCEMSEEEHEAVEESIDDCERRGMKVIVFAEATVARSQSETPIGKIVEEAFSGGNEYVSRLSFAGFAGIADPLRSDVKMAVKSCGYAGIDIRMITGDNDLTSREIATEAGILTQYDDEDCVISGSDFAEMDDDDSLEAARHIKVMSKARPSDKLKLVRVLQNSGEIVAVTGDGTNDAPALNFADVGISMGTGTEVAKEASDIVLLDDSLSTIVSAVRLGRSLYRNIQKYLLFQLTVNFAALLTALSGPVIGIEMPLTLTQMLWINLVTDTLAAVGLASELSDVSVLKAGPRDLRSFIVTRDIFGNIVGTGFLFVVVSLVLLGILSPMDGRDFSIFFAAFALLQFWNLFNVRTLGGDWSTFKTLFKNRVFLLAAVAILALTILTVQFGGNVFRTVPLSLKDWVILVISTSFVLWIGEIIRFLRRNSHKKDKDA